VLRILVVEDDSQLAATVKYLVEDNPRYRVVATAGDADTAVAAAEEHDPDLVLLDLHLANATTGFSVAVRLNDLGVACLFVTGKAPSFPMPDLALGCLPKLPDNLTIYQPEHEPDAFEPGFIPSKRSIRTRLEHWISSHQQ
jgi:hypothetical protein